MKASQPNNPARMKISEAFLGFAASILQDMPESAAPADIEKVLTMPCAVWNAVVFDHARGGRKYVTRVRKAVADAPAVAAIVEDLIERKQRLFRDDQHLIGEYRVTILGPGEINLWAEARDPVSALKNLGKLNPGAKGFP